MFVYLVMRAVEFEGSSVFGVYASVESAEAAITAELDSWSDDDFVNYSDVSFSVVCTEVQGA